MDIIKVYNKRKEEELKLNLIVTDIQVEMQAQRIAKIMGAKNVSIMTVADYVPQLFKNEKEQAEQERKEIEIRLTTERFKEFVKRKNSKFKEVVIG